MARERQILRGLGNPAIGTIIGLPKCGTGKDYYYYRRQGKVS